MFHSYIKHNLEAHLARMLVLAGLVSNKVLCRVLILIIGPVVHEELSSSRGVGLMKLEKWEALQSSRASSTAPAVDGFVPLYVKQCLATLNILLIQRLQNSMLMSLTETEVLQTGQTGGTGLITVCVYIFVQMICIIVTDMLLKPTYKQVLISPLQTQRISHWPKQVKCKNWVQGQDIFFQQEVRQSLHKNNGIISNVSYFRSQRFNQASKIQQIDILLG